MTLVLLILCAAPFHFSFGQSTNAQQELATQLAKTSGTETPSALSQTPDDSDFIGLVQFVNGRTKWIKRPQREMKEKIKFKTFIHQADAMALAKKSYVKIISFQRCTGVVFGGGKLYAPIEIDRPVWAIKSAGLRWICPQEQTQKLNINGFELTLQSAEIVFTNNTLLIKKGTVSTPDSELKINRLYKLEEGQWVPQKYNEMTNWLFDQSLTSPKESLKLTKPEKEIEPETSRWIAAHSVSLFTKMKHKESRLDIDSDKLDAEAEQLMFQIKKGEKGALLGRITIAEAHHRNDNQDTSFCFDPNTSVNNCNYDPNQHNQVEWISAELGWRSHFNKNWSLYYLGGLTQTEHRISSFYQDLNFDIHQREIYWGLTGALGVDYLYVFTGWFDWLGIYFSAELRLMMTLNHSETKYDGCHSPSGCQNNQDLLATDEHFVVNGAYFSFGPFLRF